MKKTPTNQTPRAPTNRPRIHVLDNWGRVPLVYGVTQDRGMDEVIP